MNNNDFAHLVSLKAGLTNEEAESFIKAFIATIANELKNKSIIKIDDIGEFILENKEVKFTPQGELLNLTK